MTYPPQYGEDPQWGGGYGTPPPPAGNPNTKWYAVIAVVVLIAIAGGIGIFLASHNNDQDKSAQSDGPTVTAPQSTPQTGSQSAPSTNGSTSSTSTGGSCSIPSSAKNAPNLTPTDFLANALENKTSFTTPTIRFTTTKGTSTLNSLCYNSVTQTDLGLVLAYLDGAGYTMSDGKTAQQKLFQASDTQKPKLIAITVTGTLVIERRNFDDNRGAAEIDWQD